jgi:hypothetical protein
MRPAPFRIVCFYSQNNKEEVKLHGVYDYAK